jgi:hypothetical protein
LHTLIHYSSDDIGVVAKEYTPSSSSALTAHAELAALPAQKARLTVRAKAAHAAEISQLYTHFRTNGFRRLGASKFFFEGEPGNDDFLEEMHFDESDEAFENSSYNSYWQPRRRCGRCGRHGHYARSCNGAYGERY